MVKKHTSVTISTAPSNSSTTKQAHGNPTHQPAQFATTTKATNMKTANHDFNKTELAIGDKVICTILNEAGFTCATVIGFTPCKIRIKIITRTGRESIHLKYPFTIAKYNW